MNIFYFDVISCYFALLSKKIDFSGIFQVHKSYLILVVSISQASQTTGGGNACSKKKIGKIGKKRTKRMKTGKCSKLIAHFWRGGELFAKEKGKERKEEGINIKLA
jgi:hypothetical protein